MIEINIARDFSKTPFGRYYSDSPFSAEKFRKEILVPAFKNNADGKVSVDFTGIALGIGSSFLEEAFGGLVRKEGIEKSNLKNRLIIKSKMPFHKVQIDRYIEQAQPERR
ncbi:STAS-like domain-containing protein [Pantoea agglomerans]|uniref:STAS-like domain-containing protein n=1 Tax=Enterobacter agglomerans TaxID=549 RepID=UPI0012F78045|nr:STAS-like domain-containing protein [Pantoea agglomerans]MVT81207.1 DUF4325 domain-containing protein [Pantoea agglomerans]